MSAWSVRGDVHGDGSELPAGYEFRSGAEQSGLSAAAHGSGFDGRAVLTFGRAHPPAVQLVRVVAEIEAEQVVEGESQPLAFAERGQQRNRERAEENGGGEPAGGMDAEVEEGDSEEDGDAVGDDHEHQRVAVVALIQKVAVRAA